MFTGEYNYIVKILKNLKTNMFVPSNLHLTIPVAIIILTMIVTFIDALIHGSSGGESVFAISTYIASFSIYYLVVFIILYLIIPDQKVIGIVISLFVPLFLLSLCFLLPYLYPDFFKSRGPIHFELHNIWSLPGNLINQISMFMGMILHTVILRS